MKSITLKPGQNLACNITKIGQHWIIAQGTAIVQIGDQEFEKGVGDYCYIPMLQKHRLTTNIGFDNLIIIEVQLGEYLGEDDIVRIEDIYGRE